VYVLPSRREHGTRPLPANVEVVEMGWLDGPGRAAKARALLSREAVGCLARTLAARENVRPYAADARVYLDVLARNVLKYRELARFVRERGLEDAIFYDYWFENSTLALALARRAGWVRTAVCRAHGFDLYDERWGGRPVPFREIKLDGLDMIGTVSGFGRDYLRARCPGAAGRVHTFRLGVRDPGAPAGVRPDPPLILSCGSLLPFKRVHRIAEVLERVGRPLRWVHLGDGPDRGRVERAAARLPAEVSVELRGHVANADVLRFYRESPPSLVMSQSLSEGLPVSMMEALSFGVPVVAVAVGGIPEILNPETGILLAPESSVAAAAAAVREALEPGRFDAERIHAFFRAHYDADTNYDRFADALLALREDQAPTR
jgi:glycosyltransferase involved in cell wall biosynthesis